MTRLAEEGAPGRVRPRPPSAPQRRVRQAMWLGLAVALIGLPFLSQPGRYVPDTRDALWFSPGHYLSQAFTLWHTSPFLGHEQRDAIVVPMGLFVGLLRGLGASAWVAERIWHGTLLFVAAAGMIILVDALLGRKVVIAPLAAGLIYALNPYTFGFGLATTGAFLPYVALPWLLWLVLRYLGRPGVVGPALVGLATFLMGGGNGATQVYTLLTVGLFAAWILVTDRSTSLRRTAVFAASAIVVIVALNAYWLILLASPDVNNQLLFGEQPPLINVSSSFSESIRGLGFWIYYGGDQFGPWFPAVRRAITSPAVIFAGFAVPVTAYAAAWRTRFPHRLFFLFLSILAVVGMSGIFPVGSPSPFGQLLNSAYRHSTSALGLRTTYALGGALFSSIAVLAGMGIAAAWRWAGRQVRHRVWRPALIGTATFVIAMNAVPLWTGTLYDHAHSAAAIPGYWRQALQALRPREPGFRAFFAPGTLNSFYRWGELHDGIAEAEAPVGAVHPTAVPIETRYGSDLLAAIEKPYQAGTPSDGAASLFRLLGVRDVVLQNDIDWQRSHTARPGHMLALVHDPSLQSLSSYGVAGRDVVGSGATANQATDVERGLPPVQVLTVPHPAHVVRAEADAPVIVSGDGFGLATMAREGLLPPGRPILFSGDLTADRLQGALGQDPSFVVTDSNRRRIWRFGNVQGGYSATLPAAQSLGDNPAGFDLFDGSVATQSVAVYDGVQEISAGGAPTDGMLGADAEYRPANAFDDDPRTWWLVGALGNPIGAWVQERFLQPLRLSQVELTVPGLGPGREVSSARIEFSDGSSVLTKVQDGTTTVSFKARTSDSIRVEILAVSPGVSGIRNAVGFADVSVPGVRMREFVSTPGDLFDTAAGIPGGTDALAGRPIAYAFERARSRVPGGADEEAGLDRLFRTPAEGDFSLSGTARLDPSATDLQIDRMTAGPTEVSVSSSSRLYGNPRFRGSAAFDGDPDTAWIPQGGVAEWVAVSFPRRRVGAITVHTEVGQGRTNVLGLRLTLHDGTEIVGRPTNLLDGLIRFRFKPRVIGAARFTVARVFPEDAQAPPPAIDEIRIGDVRFPTVRRDRLLFCSQTGGPEIDGSVVGVRPVGTVAQLFAGHELPVEPCTVDTIPLAAGTHRLETVRGGLVLDRLGLVSDTTRTQPPPTPRLSVGGASGAGFDVAVSDSRAPFYLVIGQNWSPGWSASIAGMDLGAPMVVDGYSAGWRVTRLGSYVVHVRYRPQVTYTLGLALSAVALLTVGVVLVVAARRRRG